MLIPTRLVVIATLASSVSAVPHAIVPTATPIPEADLQARQIDIGRLASIVIDVAQYAPNPTASSNTLVASETAGLPTPWAQPVHVGSTQLGMDVVFDSAGINVVLLGHELVDKRDSSGNVWDSSSRALYNRNEDTDWYAWPEMPSQLLQFSDGSSYVAIAGRTNVVVGDVTATSQTVYVATDASAATLDNMRCDGYIGVAPPHPAIPQRNASFFENVLASLDQHVFAADIHGTGAMLAVVPNSNQAAYVFGAIEDEYKSSLKYINVDFYAPGLSTHVWGFTGDKMSFYKGTKALDASPLPIVVDTGPTQIFLDNNTVAAYFSGTAARYDSSAPFASQWQIPCDWASDSSSPDILFVGVGDNVPDIMLTWERLMSPVTMGGGYCLSGLQGTQTPDAPQQLGDVFMTAAYIVFDAEINENAKYSVGFAAKSATDVGDLVLSA